MLCQEHSGRVRLRLIAEMLDLLIFEAPEISTIKAGLQHASRIKIGSINVTYFSNLLLHGG